MPSTTQRIPPQSKSSSSASKERSKSRTLLLERALNANPNDPFAWHLLGVHYHSRGSVDEAFKCFRRAENIKSGFSASNQYYLALCFKEKGQTNEAMSLLQSTLALPAKNTVDKKGQKEALVLLDQLREERMA